ncbi:efflux RND transporter periplasmic adaptor subunit [Pseudoalteromonas denitrificans]|uniref:HlyD family secretion protein n=1 Tax=Pseudoalteromonas denitrificans DSM 6059 TaxID=1123010 RepID=A0A1I1G3G1_9GAMM|nr:HlyD family efflux transporter periplasmic adaptor subunit [Pseudoalteromonas denitrificans]SFC05826.1 HlyD family secretion protein [Pseudoalteromonas denitrificans DSM 6059]
MTMITNTYSQDEVVEKKQLKFKFKYFTISVFILVISVLSFPSLSNWYFGIQSIDQTSLLTAKVFKGELIRDVAVSGKLIAANAPQLFSPEIGEITMLSKPGDKVTKGQIVAQLKSPELISLIKQNTSHLNKLKIDASRGALKDDEAQLDLERSLDEAKVRLNAAKRENKRSQLSFNKQVISELDFEKTKDELLEANLIHQHAQKRVLLARKRLKFENQTRQFEVKQQEIILEELIRRKNSLNIKASVAGIVGNWLVEQKERVADSQALMTIVDLSKYEAQLNVPEFYADDLGIGLKVNLTVAGKKLKGKLSAISPEINNSQVQIRITINDTDAINLRQNQRVNATIEFERKSNVLMVKRGAFLKAGGSKSVFKIIDDTAMKQPISVGISSVEFIEILSGLKENDELIISDHSDFIAQEHIKLTN